MPSFARLAVIAMVGSVPAVACSLDVPEDETVCTHAFHETSERKYMLTTTCLAGAQPTTVSLGLQQKFSEGNAPLGPERRGSWTHLVAMTEPPPYQLAIYMCRYTSNGFEETKTYEAFELDFPRAVAGQPIEGQRAVAICRVEPGAFGADVACTKGTRFTSDERFPDFGTEPAGCTAKLSPL